VAIQDVFGPNSTEDATQIVISKLDLATKVAEYMLAQHNDSTTTGYVPEETNTDESNWVAIQMAGAQFYTQTRINSNPAYKVLVSPPNTPGFDVFDQNRWQYAVTSRLKQTGEIPTLTPANF